MKEYRYEATRNIEALDSKLVTFSKHLLYLTFWHDNEKWVTPTCFLTSKF